MQLDYSPADEAFRSEIRSWLEANLPAGWFDDGFEMTPEQRKAFVCQHCVHDPSLIPDVLALLDSDAAPETPLDRPAVGTEFRLRALSLSYTATRR